MVLVTPRASRCALLAMVITWVRLHKLGRFEGNREERGGLDEDVESASHQQFDRKARLLADF